MNRLALIVILLFAGCTTTKSAVEAGSAGPANPQKAAPKCEVSPDGFRQAVKSCAEDLIVLEGMDGRQVSEAFATSYCECVLGETVRNYTCEEIRKLEHEDAQRISDRCLERMAP